MSIINKSVVVNVEASYIETYLNQTGFKRKDEEAGIDIVDWVNSLMESEKLNQKIFEEFLFRELSMGKRKAIRIYNIDSVKNIKYPEDWLPILIEKYAIDSLNFSNILDTRVDRENIRKIAAIHSDENEKGELVRIQILFVCFFQVDEGNGIRDTWGYIPVDIDFIKKQMTLKAWNRQGVVDENYRAKGLMDHIEHIMALTFNVHIRQYMIRHKQVLYQMSKGLVDNIYNKVPAFNQISELEKAIKEFEQSALTTLPLLHVIEDSKGHRSIPKGVMEVADELHKALERLVIGDYFFDKSFDEIWNMGVDAIIARIKFNDSENVLTSLSGEESEKPIFCTKTFMYLKKSMEDSKLVEKLWVVKSRFKGKLNVRYDASDERFLGILIRSGIRYTEEDLETALEIYKKYESTIIRRAATRRKRNVS